MKMQMEQKKQEYDQGLRVSIGTVAQGSIQFVQKKKEDKKVVMN